MKPRRACPICGGGDLGDFLRKDDRPLLICSRCRHVFWRDEPDQAEIDAYYEQTYTEALGQRDIQESARAYHRDHLRDLLQRSGFERKSTTLLDYGCSVPILLCEAHKMGFAGAIGVEPDLEARRYGAERGVRMLAPAELTPELEDESVDIARFSHVLEHLTDPVGVLREVVRKLRPGGMVHITQPNFPVLALDASPADLRDAIWPEHLHFFSPISLRRMLDDVGLRIETFFSHEKPDEALADLVPFLDLGYSAECLDDLSSHGEAQWGRNANFPVYAGENSAVYAFRGGRAPALRKALAPRSVLARLRERIR